MARADARVLILGSLPGARSIAEDQYYAHPRNAFWTILQTLTGVSPGASYSARVEGLVAARIALWDVCAEAVRPGSLDADIAVPSVRPNDIKGFLRAHPGVALIALNGGTASRLFRRLVSPSLTGAAALVRTVSLPSTSPAHAARSLAEKRATWCEAIRPILLP